MSRVLLRGRWVGMVVALALVLGLAVPLTTVSAQATYRVVAPNGLNLRQAPALSAAVVTVLLNGDIVTEIGSPVTSGGITWRNIRLGGTPSREGWAAATFLQPTGGGTGERDVTVTAPAGLNLRTGPGLGFAVNRVVPLGATLRATGVEAQGSGLTWRQVRVGGLLLWGAKQFLSEGTNPPPVERDYRVTAPAGLNLRTGPGLGFAVDRAAAFNTVLRATGVEQVANGLTWAEVRVGNRLLWAAKTWLQPA